MHSAIIHIRINYCRNYYIVRRKHLKTAFRMGYTKIKLLLAARALLYLYYPAEERLLLVIENVGGFVE